MYPRLGEPQLAPAGLIGRGVGSHALPVALKEEQEPPINGKAQSPCGAGEKKNYSALATTKIRPITTTDRKQVQNRHQVDKPLLYVGALTAAG